METQSANVAVVHSLKCWPEYFACILDGSKRFELRKNDRAFDLGHFLSLWEWCPKAMAYTGRSIAVRVTYVMPHDWEIPGLKDGYVVLGIEPIRETRRESFNQPAFVDPLHFARSPAPEFRVSVADIAEPGPAV